MKIRVGFDIQFQLPELAPMILSLNLHPSRIGTLLQQEQLRIEPFAPLAYYYDSFGNCCARVTAPPGVVRFTNDAIVSDTGEPDAWQPNAVQHRIEDLPSECMQFLLASRYCEVDLMKDLAWELFSRSPRGWARVQAVCDFVHAHLRFDYMTARVTRTAMEAYRERQGVCRDFTHLAITFCRALNIPARYATGYLGDIGIPADPSPMDFSAWFEVYLDGQWWTFDARHNRRRIGRVLMARGRDAVDVPLTTTFGASTLLKFHVWADELP